MNRYPLWKYLIIIAALCFGALYTLPNFFGEWPAVQIASVKATVRADTGLLTRVQETLKAAAIEQAGATLDTIGLNPAVFVRFRDEDTQKRARDLLEQKLNTDLSDPTWVVAPRGTWPRRSTSGCKAWKAICARCCATRTCDTPALPATASRW
jgi:preprotein translocase subunit SecD